MTGQHTLTLNLRKPEIKGT